MTQISLTVSMVMTCRRHTLIRGRHQSVAQLLVAELLQP